MRRAAGLLGHEGEVEAVDGGALGDGVGRLHRDDAELGLGPGQGGQHVEPPLEPAPLVEHGPQLVRPPQVGVELGVGYAGAHAGSSAAARSGQGPPDQVERGPPRHHGHPRLVGVVVLQQAALGEERPVPPSGEQPPGARVDRLREVAVEPLVDGPRPGAAERASTAGAGRVLVEEVDRRSLHLDARPLAREQVPGRRLAPGPARPGRPRRAPARWGGGPRPPPAPAGPGRGAWPGPAAPRRPPGCGRAGGRG